MATKKEILTSPLLRKGGPHGPSEKAKRKKEKDKLKKQGENYRD